MLLSVVRFCIYVGDLIVVFGEGGTECKNLYRPQQLVEWLRTRAVKDKLMIVSVGTLDKNVYWPQQSVDFSIGFFFAMQSRIVKDLALSKI